MLHSIGRKGVAGALGFRKSLFPLLSSRFETNSSTATRVQQQEEEEHLKELDTRAGSNRKERTSFNPQIASPSLSFASTFTLYSQLLKR